MTLEQPVLFHSEVELREAIKFKVIEEYEYENYFNDLYTFPTLFWTKGTYTVHQSGLKNLLDQDRPHLSILRQSIDWKDIRDKYKPKEWYELESSIGKPVWVRDSDDEDWNIDIFKDFYENNKYKFQGEDTVWRQAKPVTAEDLIQL